jgi:hypothetical protein
MRSPVHVYNHGCVEWDNVLEKTFGSAIDDVVHPQKIGRLAKFLCSRLDYALKESCFANPWSDNIDNWTELHRVFLSFSSAKLPELSKFSDVLVEDPDLASIWDANSRTGFWKPFVRVGSASWLRSYLLASAYPQLPTRSSTCCGS